MKSLRTLSLLALAAVLLSTAAGCTGGATDGDATDGAAGPGIAATWADQTVTVADLDARVSGQDVRLLQQLYEARRTALETMIADRLVERAADERGTTPEELIESEIAARLSPVTEADLADFYEHNKKMGRITDQKLEDIKPQLGAFLTNARSQAARRSFVAELREAAGVTIEIEPPRSDVSAGAEEPAIGPADAPIQIVEFSDFQCPYCARVGPTLKRIEATYGDLVRIAFLDLPLSMHADAQLAAEAAQCANDQGRFWDYHDVLFANQKALKPADLRRHATSIGLDSATFDACLDGGTHRAEVLQDADLAASMGVSGTPALFINGIFVNGVRPYEALKQMIDEELERKGIEPPA